MYKEIEINLINNVASNFQDFCYYKKEDNFNVKNELEFLSGYILCVTDILAATRNKELELIFDRVYYELKEDNLNVFEKLNYDLLEYVCNNKLINLVDLKCFSWDGVNNENRVL